MNIYITGEEVASALDKAGIVATPETALAYKFQDAAAELGRVINLAILRHVESEMKDVVLRAYPNGLGK